MGATAALYGSMAVSAGSSLITGAGQASALRAAGRYKSALAETNASMADLAGEQTIEAGDIAASRKEFEAKARSGSELATQGGSGVDVASGSSALVRRATESVGAIDALTIRNNASRAAFGYKVQAIQDRSEAKFDELTAKSQAKQSLLSGGIGAVEGPLSIFSNYKMWSRRSGMGGSSKIPDSFIPGSEDLMDMT